MNRRILTEYVICILNLYKNMKIFTFSNVCCLIHFLSFSASVHCSSDTRHSAKSKHTKCVHFVAGRRQEVEIETYILNSYDTETEPKLLYEYMIKEQGNAKYKSAMIWIWWLQRMKFTNILWKGPGKLVCIVFDILNYSKPIHCHSHTFYVINENLLSFQMFQTTNYLHNAHKCSIVTN